MAGLQVDPTVSVGDMATFVALLVAIFSIYQFRQTLKQSNQALNSTHYSELDHLYFEILKLAIAHPFLRDSRLLQTDEEAIQGEYDPLPHRSKDEQQQYEAYAHMVWCFIETLHDRCMDSTDYREQREFMNTWASAINAENQLHRGWFLKEMRREELRKRVAAANQPYFSTEKFCLGFRIFILENQWHEPEWKYRAGFAKEPEFR
jgi:hypothetical protein